MSSFRNSAIRFLLIGASIFAFSVASGTTRICAQKSAGASMYRNPILFADYSDPDVIRVGSDYYLVASTFHFVPGIPILHSKDLVHWSIAGHVIDRLAISPAYDMQGGNRYGRGVWAPAVRFHNGLFYVYFPTPDEGVFVSTAPKMTGPWTAPEAVLSGPGYEDPCPFWDDDGQAYLIHSKVGAGPLILHRMSPDGKRVLDDGKEIMRDPKNLPTLEGPKMYKRNGLYYIFAPYGGVPVGAQAVLRSKNIYGPYEYRTVLAKGDTEINGPHQGGYVETPDGKGWFIHFQSRGAHGRIVHLQPVRWDGDWPVIGNAPQGATTGEPVMEYALPIVFHPQPTDRPQTSDEFDAKALSPMWEWNHNPANERWSLAERPGFLRLHTAYAADLLHARNTVTECLQDESAEITVRLDLEHLAPGDRAGLSIFDVSKSYVAVTYAGAGRKLAFSIKDADTPGPDISAKIVQLRAVVKGDMATYFYSTDDGAAFTPIGSEVKLAFGWWKGARPAIFAFNTDANAKTSGVLDVDWVHYRPCLDRFSGPVLLGYFSPSGEGCVLIIK